MPIRILVPLERHFGLDTALPVACDLARARGAVVRLLHVAPAVAPLVPGGRPFPVAEDARRDALAFLDVASAALSGVAVETAVRFGDPADEILAEAQDVGADLIVMATRCRPAVERVLVGSAAEQVFRRSDRAVVLVRSA
jgi:nucleotide-binding universal stress UspA family protein